MNKLLTVAFFFASVVSISAQQTATKRLIMWFDAEANFARFSTPDSIRFYVQKTKDCGFTDIVLDVKPISGEVLYNSKLAKRMTEHKGFQLKDTFNYVGIFIKMAHQLGMKIHANVNVFSEGHNYFDKGTVYTTHPEWASVQNAPEGLTTITEQKNKYAAMVNPANPDVQVHELAILRELMTQFPAFDGIVLDRCRYDGIQSDFSDKSKLAFEKYIGQRIANFTDDIFCWKKDSLGKNTIRTEGVHFKKWIEWRAFVIHDFVKKARKMVKKLNPKTEFAIYTGAWYPLYFEVGVNWAGKEYDPSKNAEYQKWATPQYRKAGYQDLLDFYMTGNYYETVTRSELAAQNAATVQTESGQIAAKAYWYSVEGSNDLVREILGKRRPYVGSLYVEQYQDPQTFKRAVQMNIEKSGSLMVFDIVHIIQKNWWKPLKEAMK